MKTLTNLILVGSLLVGQLGFAQSSCCDKEGSKSSFSLKRKHYRKSCVQVGLKNGVKLTLDEGMKNFQAKGFEVTKRKTKGERTIVKMKNKKEHSKVILIAGKDGQVIKAIGGCQTKKRRKFSFFRKHAHKKNEKLVAVITQTLQPQTVESTSTAPTTGSVAK